MPAHKTDLARQALASHGAALDLRQRRALILCDGRRTDAELARLLGTDTPALLQQLRRAGYLEGPGSAHEPPAAGPARPTEMVVPNAGAPAPAARRRSLSAARIYLQGMLDLQRAPAAQALRTQLVGATDEAATIAAIVDVLAALPAMTRAGYAQRVRERVAEVMPEAHLPALAALELMPAASDVA